MAKKPSTASPSVKPAVTAGRPSALLDTRVVYCGDNLEQLAKLPDACVDLIYIDPPFNSNRNYEVFWGETHRDNAFVVRDLPWTEAKLRALPPFEFENWAVIALGGIPNKVQVGDMGVDGRIFPVGTKPAEGGLFSDDWFPIQVKQMDKVGRPDIDAFQAVMLREGENGRQRGFFVSFGYTKDAQDECNAFFKRTGRIIKLLTVREILDEEFVQKM